jgi:hypothetical protein
VPALRAPWQTFVPPRRHPAAAADRIAGHADAAGRPAGRVIITAISERPCVPDTPEKSQRWRARSFLLNRNTSPQIELSIIYAM